MLSHKRTLDKLRKGVNIHAWGMGPLTVNAYYDPTKNKFVMPIGILQYPFFVPEGDIIENLGAVGAVVGHELGHAIDDEGSKFNAEGKLKQWMTDDDVKKFKLRGEKMAEQFSKIGHNGQLTLGENVADLVGLTFAYNAAFPANLSIKKENTEDKRKFFVAYARLWCDVMRDKRKEMQLKTDPHSLGYARINEQMKHQSGFQEAYSCKKGDKLYLDPKERIQIW
jgi:putative endopeptidase